jgi:hypothetical protein
VHNHLHRALAPVLHDLEATGAPVPRVEGSDWQDWPGAESALLWSADRSGAGVWVDTDRSDAEQVAMLADQAQDWVVEELARAGSTNWPPCPDHPDNHPLTAGVHHGTASWSCPTSGRVVSEIGRLGAGRR